MNTVILGTLIMLLSACANVELYVPKEGDTPHGYYAQQITPNSYLVSYETYKPITSEEVESLALRYAAELTRELKFGVFEVIHTDLEENVDLVESPELRGTTYASLHGSNTAVTPAYTREVRVKRVTLEILMSEPL
ncbi:MAG: hypothetical protein MI864_11735 [Pseudomonadales bacterium]|nr:hypothetical protein [Oleiphilus messinensis]MCG8611199.1 hypothetical protein [Pseudomonadales bacterium]